MKVMKITTFTFIAMLIVSFISCENTQRILQSANQPMSGLSGEITVGVVLPQTGDLGPTNFGPGALVMENGFNMALEEINTSKMLGDATLKFIIEDDMSTVDGAVAAFEKLIHQDKVPAILGVWTSGVAERVFPIAQQNGVVAFSPVVIKAGLTKGDYLFRASQTTEVLIPWGVKKTQAKLGYQRVVTLADSVDVFSIDSDAVFRRTLTENGVTILNFPDQTFETGEIDFSTQLRQILVLEPEAIFVSSQQREMIHILTQAQDLNFPADVPFISLVLSIDEIQKANGAAEGSITFTDWVATADTPGNQKFVEKYTAEYGMEPSVWAAQSYAAVYVFAQALLDAQSTESTAIAKALAQIKDFDTILGKFSFDANGDAVYDPVALIVKNGKLEVFE
jgi:branched-chain amino acid transport system substrate-binding protein